jgi:hypothetical protein
MSALAGPGSVYCVPYTDRETPERVRRPRPRDYRKRNRGELLYARVMRGVRPTLCAIVRELVLDDEDQAIALVAADDRLGFDKSRAAWRVVPVEEEQIPDPVPDDLKAQIKAAEIELRRMRDQLRKRSYR